MVFGYDRDVSYGYPGGMDLGPDPPPPVEADGVADGEAGAGGP